MLIQADSLAKTAPDSAYSILTQIEHPEKMAEPEFAYWCMISGKIFIRRTDRDKTFLPPSFYERACRYYEKQGTTEQQAFIRLYHGWSYRETGIYNQAMQIYTETLKDAKAWNEYNAAGMICSHMGDLYQIESLSDRCKEKYRESLYFFKLANNQERVAYAYTEIGFQYINDKNPEESLAHFLQADTIAQSIQDSVLIGDIYYYLGVAYNDLSDLPAAEQYLLKALQFSPTKNDSVIVYFAISDFYIAAGNYAKAREVLERGRGNLTKDGLLHQNYLIEKGGSHFEQALDYLEQYQQTIDSARIVQKKMHLLEIEEKYNLEHAENQKNKARIDAFRYLILLLIVLAAFLFSIILYHLMRKRKNRVISEQSQELGKADGVISHISTQLQQEKESLKKAKDILLQTNQQYDSNLSDLQLRIDSLYEDMFTAKLEKIIHITTIGQKIREITGKATSGEQALTSNEWKTLGRLFRQTFPSLEALFWNPAHPFTETERHLSLLTFFNLEAKHESIIINVAPISVYKQRTRLRQKLQLEEGTNLFKYLKSYCIEQEQTTLPG